MPQNSEARNKEIRKLRDESGMSITDLSQRFGVSERTVYRALGSEKREERMEDETRVTSEQMADFAEMPQPVLEQREEIPINVHDLERYADTNGYPLADEYKPDFGLVHAFIHTHPWRQTEDQHEKWLTLLRQLCEMHQISPVPDLVIGGFFPCYDREQNTIVIDKYSIITFLHQLALAYGWEDPKAKTYGETVLLAAYKPARRKLERNELGWLMKKPEFQSMPTGDLAAGTENDSDEDEDEDE